VTRKDIRQIYNSFNATAGLESNDLKNGFYDISLGFNYIGDNYNASETQIINSLNFNFNGDEALKFGLSSDVLITKYNFGEEGLNRNLIRAQPYAIYSIDNLRVKAGLNFVYENDTINKPDAPKLHYYPVIRADYKVGSGFNVYAGIDGDIKMNTLQSFANENIFLNPGSAILNTNNIFNTFAGFKGRVSNLISLGGGLNYGNFRNMHFFVNGEQDSTKFDVIYSDGSASLLNVHGEIGFNKSDIFRSVFRADYFKYNIENQAKAWHRPEYKISFLNTYNLADKIFFGADLYWLGGINGLNLQSGNTARLKDIIDLNLKVDYVISQKFSAFLSANNLLAQKYQRYWNYPSRSILLMAGLTYSF
jgi:hypothetical protein